MLRKLPGEGHFTDEEVYQARGFYRLNIGPSHSHEKLSMIYFLPKQMKILTKGQKAWCLAATKTVISLKRPTPTPHIPP